MTALTPSPQSSAIYVRLSDTKAKLGVHKSTIYRWAQSGRITIHRLGAGYSAVRVSEFHAAMTPKEQ